MKSPVISVVLPVYNGEMHLSESIDSILLQSFTNFELIIINDGSTDRSLDIISSFAAKDSRIRVISRPNKGLIYSLNEGIESARGEYVARMDADDVSLPLRFEKQLNWIGERNADICGGWIRLIDPYGKPFFSSIVKYPMTDNGIRVGLLFGCMFAHPTVLIRKAVLDKFKYDNNYKHAEDYEFWTRLIINGAVGANVPEVVLNYRMHDAQVSNVNEQIQHNCSTDIARNYWLFFLGGEPVKLLECLIDRRSAVKVEELRDALRIIEKLELKVGADSYALDIVRENRNFLLFRATALGLLPMLRVLRNQDLTYVRKFALSFGSIFYIGKAIDLLRNFRALSYKHYRWLRVRVL